MSTVLARYLDDLRQRHGLRSDAALCAQIGVEPPRMSRLRSGLQLMSPYIMLRIHEGLGEPVAAIRAALPPEAFAPEARPHAKAPTFQHLVPPDRLLAFIARGIGAGKAPTIQEMANYFDGSRGGVEVVLQHLVDSGKVLKKRGRHRGLELAL